MSTNKLIPNFQSFGLPNNLIKSLDEVGYETPSPIQSAAIPVLLEGADLVGRAPTGTGKTAAFALPLLTKIELKDRHQQVLVLTPTRELAIQVAEAFRKSTKKSQIFFRKYEKVAELTRVRKSRRIGTKKSQNGYEKVAECKSTKKSHNFH